MAELKPTKTVFTVGHFLLWQRSGTLDLKPFFQRREVWSAKLKSLLIDTIVNGLPMPIIFLRQVQDMNTLDTSMEVVDGQQRLRTILGFIEPSCLPDFDKGKDEFTVKRTHNESIAGTPFKKLPEKTKKAILSYEISTHVFPPGTGDQAVLRVFARLNSTGAKLTPQEVRNASWHGEFKTLSFDLALENLERWRSWGIFSDRDIARMMEVESVSDYLLTIMKGIDAKSKRLLDAAYERYEDSLPGLASLRRRFQRVMDAIDMAVGSALSHTRLRRQALFYSLFVACYDHMYRLKTKYTKAVRPKPLPKSLLARVQTLSEKIEAKSLPEPVQEAMDRATAHKGTRMTRHKYFMKALGLGRR